jgi:hypothetical protein
MDGRSVHLKASTYTGQGAVVEVVSYRIATRRLGIDPKSGDVQISLDKFALEPVFLD